MSDIAIKAEGLSKYYKLGVINNGTFFKDVQTWMARKTGKEDPNAKIGSKYDPTAEGFWALKDLNFEIKQGDRVGIIGKNGAGKSTLLKVLSRVTAPTEGDVKIKGRIASLLEVGTGFHPELTGRENIYLNGAILGMKRREVDRKIDEIIAFSEIEKHIDTPVKRYSSGMYVRLAFAVAAHLDSEILIADEVLAVGDAAFQKKALGKMNELSTGQGRTVLFVSHNIPMVKQLCNKGIVLNHGRKIVDSDIDEAISSYLYNPRERKTVDEHSLFSIPELEADVTVVDYDDVFEPGKDFSVTIELDSEKVTDNVGVQVMISTSEGRRYSSTNTITTEGLRTGIKKGHNKFVCTFKNLLIPSGTYYLGIGFDQPQVKFYFQEETLYTFSVKEAYFDDKRQLSNNPAYGLVYPTIHWDINE